jgi:hypothetical protein
MKTLLTLLAFSVLQASASDFIDLKNRVTTFTNLQGETFTAVTLIRGDLDGVIWRKDGSGGRVCYTNLNPQLMRDWGIPTNRIAIALARAERASLTRAKARAVARAQATAEAQAKAREKAQWEAGAAVREREAQKQKDAQEIAMLSAQIDAANVQMRRARAIAHDFNHANAHNDVPRVYIKETEQLKIDEAKGRLVLMRREFVRKYHTPAE